MSTNGSGISRENETVVRNLFEQVLNQGRLEIIPEIMAVNSSNHGPSLIGCYGGSNGYRQLVASIRDAFPDVQFGVSAQVATEDKVVLQWTLNGTHMGPLQGIEPTGRSVSVTGTIIYRLAEGKIQESWGNWDALGMVRQLGLPSDADLV
jgi:steroid delta-isomerase-like uncharacterized protein